MELKVWGAIQDRLRSDWGKFGEENWEQEIWVEFVEWVTAKNKRETCKLFLVLLTACWSKSIFKLTLENHELLLPPFSLRSFSQFGNLFYQNYSQIVRPFIPSANLFMLIRNLSFGLPLSLLSWIDFDLNL